MLFLGALLAATILHVASPVPTGNHTCTGVIKHPVTVLVNVTEPVTYRTYTWCLRVPPRCSKYIVQLKDRVKLHTEMHNKTITVCCNGYVEMENRCVPACPEGMDCPFMRCNRTNHCHCIPGYTGLYCNDACPRGVWGKDCKRPCDCPTGYTCHHLTGDCFVDDRPPRRTTTTTTTTTSTTTTERPTTAPTTEGTTLETVKTPVFRFPPPAWAETSSPTKKTTTRQVSQEEAPPTKEMDVAQSTYHQVPVTVTTLPTEKVKEVPRTERLPILEFVPPLGTEESTTAKEIPIETPQPTEPRTVKKNVVKSDEMAVTKLPEVVTPPPQLLATSTTYFNLSEPTTTITLPTQNAVFKTNAIVTDYPSTFTSPHFKTTPSTIVHSETTLTIEDRPTRIAVELKPVTSNTEYFPPTTTTPVPTVSNSDIFTQSVTTVQYIETKSETRENKAAEKTLENDIFTKSFDLSMNKDTLEEKTHTSTANISSIHSNKVTLPNYQHSETEFIHTTKHMTEATVPTTTLSTEPKKQLKELHTDFATTTETRAVPTLPVSTQFIVPWSTTQQIIPPTTSPTTISTTTSTTLLVSTVSETSPTNDALTTTTTESPTTTPTVASPKNPTSTVVTTTDAPTVTKATAVPSSAHTSPTVSITTATTPIPTTTTTTVATVSTTVPTTTLPTTTVPSTTSTISSTFILRTTPALFSTNAPLTTTTMTATSTVLPSTTKTAEDAGIHPSWNTRPLRTETTAVPLPVLIDEVFKEINAQKKLKMNETTSIHSSSPDKPKKKHEKLKNKGMNVKELPTGHQTKSDKQSETRHPTTTEISFKSILHAETLMNASTSVRPVKNQLVPDLMNNRRTTETPPFQEMSNSKMPNMLWHPHKKETNVSDPGLKEQDEPGVPEERKSIDSTELDRVMESNTIDYRQNSGEPPKRAMFDDEETHYSLFSNKIKFNVSGGVAAGVSARRQETSYSHTPVILATGVGLVTLVLLTLTLWIYLRRRRRERAEPFPPCIMAYASQEPPPLDFDMFDHPFFCQTFTNNYGVKINRELRELSYDHPRNSQSEPLYAEIHN